MAHRGHEAGEAGGRDVRQILLRGLLHRPAHVHGAHRSDRHERALLARRRLLPGRARRRRAAHRRARPAPGRSADPVPRMPRVRIYRVFATLQKRGSIPRRRRGLRVHKGGQGRARRTVAARQGQQKRPRHVRTAVYRIPQRRRRFHLRFGGKVDPVQRPRRVEARAVQGTGRAPRHQGRGAGG